MPALFSRKSKSVAAQGVDAAKVRHESLSPTPSMADARALPRVPTKQDLPPLPIASSSSSSSSASVSPTPAAVSEFGVVAAPVGASASLRVQGSKKAFLSPAFSNTLGSRRRSISPISSPAVSPNPGLQVEAAQAEGAYAYGYTPKGWDTHLDANRVHALVEACAQQIRTRGLDSPRLFSSMALDLSPINVTALIASYLGRPTTASHPFREELEFANPHDLAALIKWAFARMIRVLAVPVPPTAAAAAQSNASRKQQPLKEELVYIQQRGFLDLDQYTSWRETERAQQYPPAAFDDFVAQLTPDVARLLTALFALLASTVSYSFKNGMVPSRLCKHFGALLFGLPEDETFARTYDAFIRASHAAEHLLLAYIRAQAALSSLPPRLAEHVQGYPSMLAFEAALPSASAKLVPITQIERTVRLYSPDLIQTACETDLAVDCPEWAACLESDVQLGKDPQLSDRFRKLVNLRGGAVQGRKLARTPSPNTADHNVHNSLADKQWDDFLFDGFAAPDKSKLAFDLNESVRRNRGAAKRGTVQWSDFTKSGFAAQEDETLSTALSFDDTLKQDVQNWPADRAQLTAKLRAGQDKLPDFHYDVTPRLVASPTQAGTPGGVADAHPISRFDESFADVWADYLVANGWSSRDELTHRAASFVVVQYKSRPNASTVGSQADGSSLEAPTRFQAVQRKDDAVQDSRVDAAWFVIQEVVPAQYRADLEASGVGKKGRSLNSLAVMRKLTQFRTALSNNNSNSGGGIGGRDKQPAFVVTSRSPSRNDSSPNPGAEDVFQPGPGGTTKHIMLSDQNLHAHSRDSTTSSSSGSTARDPVPPEKPPTSMHTQSRSEGHPPASTNNSNSGGGGAPSGATKLISSLRAKSLRVVKSTRRGISSFDHSRDPAAAAPNSAPLGRQKGDISADRSFTSANYETRSVADDTATTPRLTAGPYPVPERKSSAQYRFDGETDEPWVDVQRKSDNINNNALGLGDEVPRSSTPSPRPPGDNGPAAAAAAASLGVEKDNAGSSRPSSPLPPPPAPSASTSAPAPAPALDPAAAARAALKPRDRSSIPSPPGSAAGVGTGAGARGSGTIDTKKLVESLRAGLSPVDAVRAAKDSQPGTRPVSVVSPAVLHPARVGSPVSPTAEQQQQLTSSPVLGYRDPFAKDPIAGRVADVASKFGGKGAVPLAVVKPAVSANNKPLPPPQQSEEDGGGISVDTLARSGLISPDSGGEASYESAGAGGGDNGAWREPYQPGMPLDNVTEETDSVMS